MYAGTRPSAGLTWVRGGIVIVLALALYGLAAPARAEAHGKKSVIALDYRALLASDEVVAPGVRARVLDGNRKLELTVDPSKTVLVRGYAGERFLRFSSSGVFVNVASPTALSDKLTPGAAPVLDPKAPPRWKLMTSGHRFTWHDHRLGPRATPASATGRIGAWSIPIVVDGSTERIEGSLWRAAKPALWPWILLWLLAPTAGLALATRASRRVRRTIVPVGSALCAGMALAVAVGFAASSARTGVTRWLEVLVPAAIAAGAIGVFLLRARHRVSAAACVAGFAFASALQDIPVFAHGFVISSLPAQVVRAGVAIALASGAFVLVLALFELWRGAPHERPVPRPRPQMAIPRGRTR